MSRIADLQQERGNLIHECRAILDALETEKRDFTAEEKTKYERMDAEIDALEARIEAERKQENREKGLGESEGRQTAGAEQHTSREQGGILTADSEEYRAAFNSFILEGRGALSNEEIRAMQADSDIGGGYLVAPQQMVLELLKNVDDAVAIRGLARVIQLRTAKSLGVPMLDKDADEADWTAELKTGAETELEFGKRELRPHPLAKRVKISNTLLRMAAMSPEAIVRERLAYKFAVTEEKAFLLGDGVQKPLGVFTASNDGIGTARDVSEGNTATQIKADGLINVKYALKQQYQRSARWIFHRDAIKEIRKLKDGNGQYLWQAGLQQGAPDRILDTPYVMSEFAPNTFTTGQYVGIIGDFSNYWIAEALDMAIQRLVELYAETNQTGFIARMEVDGAPAIAEAFARVKLG